MMPARARLWLLWRSVVVAVLILSAGCHMVFGGFEEQPAVTQLPSVAFCEKGSFRCNREFLLACSADQQSWVRKDTCASEDQCDSTAGVCTICPKADMMRCRGADREACSANRSEWTFVKSCDKPELCSPNGCGPCEVVGQLQCAAEGEKQIVLKECSKDKVWVTVSTCPNDEICMATKGMAEADPNHWERGKCAGKCTPGAVQCNGTNLQRCPPSGLDWMQLAPCANEALCQATLTKIQASPDMGATLDKCEAGCGAPGVPRCTAGNALERCSDDRLAWKHVMQCSDGLTCSTAGEGGCIICTPGEYQCNGAVLQKCNAEHVWVDEKDCKQPALCSLIPDANGALTQGECRTPVCDRPGQFNCGTEADPKALTGNHLYYCDTDQTALGLHDVCLTPELCRAQDQKCAVPTCGVNQRRCNPASASQVQVCNKGRTGWDTVATCAAGEFCDPSDAAQPCKTQCPAALFCNERFLMACSATGGVVQRAECKTPELCGCALTKTCPAGTSADGCGVPVCGDPLASNRCTDAAGTAAQGPLLQVCKAGRDGWDTTTATNCTSSALCYAGEAPFYKNGYCATCPIAGEIACSGSSTRTCSTDRKSWTGQMNCGFGCVTDPSTTDYCAACMTGELRCSGDLKQLLACSADRKTTPLQRDCPFGCVNSGIADYCGNCGVGEKRCMGTAPGAILQTCNADQQGLGMNTPCANGCIDSGLADYCSDCVVGTTQCSAGGVRTCGADGHWGAVTACSEGCVTTTNGRDYCGGCGAGELRCSGSTLQQCAADRRSLEPVTPPCGTYGCVDSGMADYCAQCSVGELRCAGNALTQCSTDQKTLPTLRTCDYGCIDRNGTDYCAACVANERRCVGEVLNTCNTDRTALIPAASACANGCQDSGTADYCGDCREGQTRCGANGGLQTCTAAGRWPAEVACSNGASCYGTAPSAYCGDCVPGQRRCSGSGPTSGVMTCDANGRWPATPNETCTRGCIDSGTADYCAVCNAGDTTCSGSTKLTCDAATGRYPTTGEACGANGCWGSGTTGACGVCAPGQSQCAATGNGRQECFNGQWQTVETCDHECVNSGTEDFCGECVSGDAQCVAGTSRRVCTMGEWGTAAPCPNQACVDKECTACSPNDTQCVTNDPTRYRTCTAAGTWGAPALCPNQACFNDACVDCMPGDEECTDTSHLRTCSMTGTWQAPEECPDQACLGNRCVACMPNDTECVDSARQRVCSPTGTWATSPCDSGACVGDACADCMPGSRQCNAPLTNYSTCSPTGQWMTPPTACDYGCIDNGEADYCLACPDGAVECVSATMKRTCDGTWMTSGCQHGCFNAPGNQQDYCRDCAEDAAECLPDNLQRRVCDAQGHWASAPACENFCLNGGCVDCEPEAVDCQDAMYRKVCNASGAWVVDAEPCEFGCVDRACAPMPPDPGSGG